MNDPMNDPANELEDDEMILYHYGESDDPEAIRRRIEASEEARARYETLRRVLESVDGAVPIPERGADYGTEVWARLAPRLAREQRPGRVLPFRLIPSGFRRQAAVWAAAALVLLAVGFGLGRLSQPAALPQQARDRILLATVAAHLDRSERLLMEVSNGSDAADLAAESAWARDLLAANRLYRQSAQQAGRQRLAGLLDEIEPFLLDLAHAPEELPGEEIRDLRERIAAQSLLFKVRIASNRLDAGKQTL
ncbi:MAG TPA: hypothetical protein VKK31_06470 [Thermoanaerobaculia bacterium]|nr:hypothetical protein [Thermoanaerobaculia bacterium]